jgi:hypothetical protein
MILEEIYKYHEVAFMERIADKDNNSRDSLREYLKN